MDVRIIKVFLLVAAMLVFLPGCATLPAQNFKFSLSENSPAEATWSQERLAPVGSLLFKFQLQQLGHDAADVGFKFGIPDDQSPTLVVHVDDNHCVGAYTVTVRYKVDQRESRAAYFKTRLSWDEDSTLAIQWNKKDQAIVTINGSESLKLNLSHAIDAVRVDVARGGIDVRELIYRDSSPTLN